MADEERKEREWFEHIAKCVESLTPEHRRELYERLSPLEEELARVWAKADQLTAAQRRKLIGVLSRAIDLDVKHYITEGKTR